MQYYYSSTTNMFYVDVVHGTNMPADAHAVSEEVFTQTVSSGYPWGPDAQGNPQVLEPQP